MKHEAQRARRNPADAHVEPPSAAMPIDAGIAPDALAPIVWYQRAPLQRRLRLLVRLVGMTPAEIVHRVGRHRGGKKAVHLRAIQGRDPRVVPA